MYDYCVVGTGPSAFFLVKKILQKKPFAEIVVIEAGSNNINSHSYFLDMDFIGAPFRLDPTTNVGFGGTSELWHNVMAPLDPIDFKKRNWVAGSGWPISFEEVLPYYKSVSEYFSLPFEMYDLDFAHKALKNEFEKVTLDTSIFKPKIFLQPKDYFRSKKEFTKLNGSHNNLRILQNHFALELKFEDSKNNTKATSLICGLPGRKIKRIEAKNFILCAGALRTPRILQNSHNISKNIPMLGKNLLDHPMGNYYQIKYSQEMHTPIYSDMKLSRNWKIKSAITMTEEFQSRRELPNSAFYLRPSFYEGVNQETEEAKLNLLTLRKKVMSFQLPAKEIYSLLTDANLVRQVLLYKTGMWSRHKLVDFMFVTEQLPNVTSEVKLSNDLDEWGYRRSEVNWELSQKDISSMGRMYDIIKKGMVDLNDASYTYDSEKLAWKDRFSSAAHHLGTCKMSYTIKDGCVDVNSKVHGFKNIFVADGSVFPTAGNANSTFTCMALAERLGDILTNEK